MNERLPYEEHLAGKWNDLPLPDETLAWADMKRRLDEDEDKPLLPFWLRGCAGWGLIGLLVLGLAWWIFRSGKGETSKTKQEEVSSVVQQAPGSSAKDSMRKTVNGPEQVAGSSRIPADTSTAGTPFSPDPINPESGSQRPDQEINLRPASTQSRGTNNKDEANRIETGNRKPIIRQSGYSITAGSTTARRKPVNPKAERIPGKPTGEQPGLIPETMQQQPARITENLPPQLPADTGPEKPTMPVIAAANQKEPVPADSVKQPVKDSAASQTPPVTTSKEKKDKADSSQKQPLSWSAGIGLQQQLPVAGQKWNPYNAQGRKGTLADYIPSVYMRLARPAKWFLQAEFRYGAPQYTKEQVYQQTIVSDTGTAPRFYFRNSSLVKKTYYHQLPLVFNYYLLPHWSAGAGIQWNRFYSAISENERLYHDNILGTDSVFSKTIQRVRADSATAFKKSFMQGLVETQYQWKRFSFGARYTFGLQPYLEFTLPQGGLQKEKINNLQLFIRFELWKQRNRSVKATGN